MPDSEPEQKFSIAGVGAKKIFRKAPTPPWEEGKYWGQNKRKDAFMGRKGEIYPTLFLHSALLHGDCDHGNSVCMW